MLDSPSASGSAPGASPRIGGVSERWARTFAVACCSCCSNSACGWRLAVARRLLVEACGADPLGRVLGLLAGDWRLLRTRLL